jgi:hypothetical protein
MLGIICGAGVVFNTEIVNYELEHRVSRNMREDSGYNCICMVAVWPGERPGRCDISYHSASIHREFFNNDKQHTAGVGQEASRP